MLLKMRELIRWLNSPQLVAQFQRACGVLPRKPSDTPHPPKAGKSRPVGRNGAPAHTPPTENGTHTDSHHDITDSDSSNENINGVAGNTGAKKNLRQRPGAGHSRSFSDVVSSESEWENEDYVITNKILYYVLCFGASLGNELFYITFFPFWFWNIDGYVGRRVFIFWVLFMFLGQATKDVVRWPRPSSPPVIRMEDRYALEYGMPSTHAMVGAGIPFGILFLTLGRYQYPHILGWIAAITWCSTVCFSRIYLGMHSVLDVIVGLLYVFGLMVVVFPFLDAIDYFILTHPMAPYACILVPLGLSLSYPTLDRWSTARGDTTLILGVGAGISLAHWFSFQYGYMHPAATPPPYDIIWPTWIWFGQMMLRLVIGVVILIATRAIMKTLTYTLLCKLVGVNSADRKTHQRLAIELPYKFITYMVVAFNAVFVAPQVYRLLGIERPTFFTEI